MNLDKYNIKTGDVLLFSGNTPTGFMLRTFTSSVWNHVGIVVRFNSDKNITLDNSGDIYVLETNTGVRKDHLSNKMIRGVGYSKLEYSIKNYNKVSVRRLKDKYRTNKLIDLTHEFYNNNIKIEFPNESIPFINVWLGFKLWDSQCSVGMNKFCSQLSAEYYFELYKHFEQSENLELNNILDEKCPIYSELYTPEHFSYNLTPNSIMFENKLEEDIFIQESDIWYIIIQPLILILAFIIFIWIVIQIFTQ